MSTGGVEALPSPRRSLSPLLPKSDLLSPKKMSPIRRSSRSDRENTPPPDPNVQVDRPASPLVQKKSPSRLRNITKSVDVARSEEETTIDAVCDSSVKVVVRIRPVHDHEKKKEEVAKKVSSDSLLFGERSFTFNSVMGPESSQEEVFQLVGLPLVKDSMAGYNTSIISYGESGSGKTYTMWGPLSAMLEDNSIDASQGIAPRIFHMLFQEIQKIQQGTLDKQTSFQCRCSFLEVHNDQINDLLDTSQRNLKIKDDSKNGFYVENLTEENVTSLKDVIQIIVKGLSSRRVGTTSMNSKSSRSHIILTCIIESWSKDKSTKSFSNSKASRISLVDLAGSDRAKVNEDEKHYTKEGKQVHKSLSALGKLVNVLAGKGEDTKIPYTCSCLTNLMREYLGGNGKTAFICTVSSDASCRNGTLSTLRFAEQVKRIENKPVVNEITEDYVNDLTDQIRHLKEELIREKSYPESPLGAIGRHLRVEKARQSLNLLRVNLNRSLNITTVDDVYDEEEEVADVNEDDVSQLCEQIDGINSTVVAERDDDESLLDEPPSSESPKFSSSMKKSFTESPLNHSEIKSVKKSEVLRSSVQLKKLSPTESLAASLQRGLQVINYHKQNSSSEGSPLSFSFDHLITNSTEASASKSTDLSPSKVNPAMEIIPFSSNLENPPQSTGNDGLKNNGETYDDIINRKNELEKICIEQAAKIDELNKLVEKYEAEQKDQELPSENTVSSSVSLLELLKNGPSKPPSSTSLDDGDEDIEAERQRWNESESRWICLADELRIDLESQRRLAECRGRELAQEQSRAGELDDALRRAMLSHARLVEHYAELQETHGELLDRHRRVMHGVAQVKRAAARAGGAAGSVLAESLAAELSSLRVEREREIAFLKKQNRGLQLQLKDTAEAVHAAGELLVRLRETEQAASAYEGKWEESQGEVERLKKQMRKMKEKHSAEMETVKHLLANSRLPESALEPLFRAEKGEDAASSKSACGGVNDDESWRAAFVPAYR